MTMQSRRKLLTGAAALAAYAALGHNGGPALDDVAQAGVPFFRAPANPFTILGSSVAAWWCAQDYVRMTDDGSGLISNWNDRVTALSVTATTTARPTWGATSFNGTFPGLTFDGVANCLLTSTLTALPTGANAGEIWALCTQVSAQTSTVAAYGAITAGQLRRVSASGTFHPFVTDGTTNNQDAGANLLSSPAIVSGQFFSTTENGWINGTAFTPNPTTIGSLNTGTTRLRIGASNSTSAASFFGGVISDVMVISGTLSTSQRQQLEGFFAWNRGLVASLPNGHPYQGAPP